MDASAVGEVLLARPAAASIRGRLAAHPEVHVPEHFHIEVISLLRRYALRGELPRARAARALRSLEELRAVRYPVLPLASSIWALREALSAYDAAYLALAEAIDALVLTADSGLSARARAAGRLADVGL